MKKIIFLICLFIFSSFSVYSAVIPTSTCLSSPAGNNYYLYTQNVTCPSSFVIWPTTNTTIDRVVKTWGINYNVLRISNGLFSLAYIQ